MIRILVRRVAPLLACSALVLLLGARAAGQSQQLFSDDFMDGGAKWAIDNGGGGLWHPGGCVSGSDKTGLVSYNNGPCNYLNIGVPSEGSMTSRSVLLSGQGPFYVVLQYYRKLDSLGGDQTILSISDAGVGNWTDVPASLDNSGTIAVTLIPIGSEWSGRTVQFRLRFLADGVLNDTLGWEIDNFVVENTSGWTDLGDAHAGTTGLPHLAGNGTLQKNPPNILSLTNAKPSSTSALFFGLSQLNAPFKGGVLVPQPLLTVVLPTSATGTVTVPLLLPTGIPPGTTFYLQFWIQDAGASSGFSASNAVKGSTS